MDQDISIIPVSAIIPTANRSKILFQTLKSIAAQNVQPAEIIIIDASENTDTKKINTESIKGLQSHLFYLEATVRGAASQRNQGIAKSNEPFIFFMDDDIELEPFCISRIWQCMQTNPLAGAVNAMITNQQYLKPGKLTALMYRLMSGKKLTSYAGLCIGPAWNLLPEDRDDLPEYQFTEWLNTTCTLYRKEVLPHPVFEDNFKGYSFMEDLTLSLTVGKNRKLINVRTARIFHNSQPGEHKKNLFALEKMQLINRHFVMTKILGRNKAKDFLKLYTLEIFNIMALLRNPAGWIKLPSSVAGKFSGIVQIWAK